MRTYFFAGLLGLLLVNVAFSSDKEREANRRIMIPMIIGGCKALPMAFPWMVSLQRKEKEPVPNDLRKSLSDSKKVMHHNCAGSIVNMYWIVTAGHCVGKPSEIGDQVYDPTEWQVGIGSNDLAQIYEKNQYKPIEAFYRHPRFDGRHQKYDIGLIKLVEPLVFSKTVQPACLDFEERAIYDGAMQIIGWGSVVPIYKEFGKGTTKAIMSRCLKEATIFDKSQAADCDHKQNICATNEHTGETGCAGDSGGPIHYTKNGKSSVVGVFSLADSNQQGLKRTICAGKMSYTRLSSFKGWVKSHIGQTYCS